MEPFEISRPRTSASAIASLVCGLLGCVPFLTGLAALILGLIGIKKTRDPMVTGRGMAIAGLVLGCFNLIGWALFVASFSSLIFFAFQAAEPARLKAEQFTRDLSEGKLDAAVASSVEGIDRAKLEALSERMKPWGAFKNLGLNSINIQTTNGKAEYKIGGIATFATETRSYSMTLYKTGETYKVVTLDIP